MRSIQLGDEDVAIIFRGEMGAIDLDASGAGDDDSPAINSLLAQALIKRCSEDPDFVDDQIRWFFFGEDHPQTKV